MSQFVICSKSPRRRAGRRIPPGNDRDGHRKRRPCANGTTCEIMDCIVGISPEQKSQLFNKKLLAKLGKRRRTAFVGIHESYRPQIFGDKKPLILFIMGKRPNPTPPSNRQHWSVYTLVVIGVASLVIAYLAWRKPVLPISERPSASESFTNFVERGQPATKANEQTQAQQKETNGLANRQDTELVNEIKPREVERQQQSHENAAVDLKAYKERYLMPIGQKQNITLSRLAVAAASQGQFDTDLADSMSLMASRSGFSTMNGLLKPEFVSDGLFDKAFHGEFDSLDALALTNRCDFLVLGQFTTTVSSRPTFQANVVDGKLQIRLFRVGNWQLLSSKEYDTNAAAFQPEDAIALVHKKFLDLLTTNSLPYHFTTK